MKYKQLKFAFAVGAALAAGTAAAAELLPGTVINKDNLDKFKGDTFEGKTIGSMLPERIEWQIRNWGLQIKIKHAQKIELDPHDVEATKKYAAEVKFDPATREVSNYKAGLPFPNVDPNDPHGGDKLLWNFYYASNVGQVMDFRKFAFLLIDGDKGIERTQHWYFLRYFMKNRVMSDKPVEGDGSVFTKTLLFATYPQDIRGVGTYTVRYDDTRVEDNWAYVKSVRRTRRLSGGVWMDPIGGTDQLNDDVEIWNARPSWYASNKFVGTRWVLAVANHFHPWDESKKGTPQEWPSVDLKNPPYWNPIAEWEPREVYVIESTPPGEHPYSKKVIYMDKSYPRIYFGEAYDKKGEFWKFFNFLGMPKIGDDGYKARVSAQGHTIDFKRKHATIFVSHPSWKVNTKGVKTDDVTLGQLEAAGQGK